MPRIRGNGGEGGMRLVSVLSAKAIWLFETVEMNPRGFDLHSIFASIRNRYSFSTPRSREEVEASKDGTKFLNGTFRPDGDRGLSVAFSFFDDGLVAETMSSTNHSEAFLEDVVAFAKKQHGLSFEPTMVRKRTYSSRVIIESDCGFGRIREVMSPISEALSETTGKQFDVTEIVLGFDPGEQADGLTSFTVARRAGVPFSSNRFFSSAPLSTEAHLKLLESFESLMA